jgi:hypothetical protein
VYIPPNAWFRGIHWTRARAASGWEYSYPVAERHGGETDHRRRPNFNTRRTAMPPVSKRQANAMRAAAAGNSNLGIPRKVGQEYTKSSPPTKSLPDRAPKKK